MKVPAGKRRQGHIWVLEDFKMSHSEQSCSAAYFQEASTLNFLFLIKIMIINSKHTLAAFCQEISSF